MARRRTDRLCGVAATVLVVGALAGCSSSSKHSQSSPTSPSTASSMSASSSIGSRTFHHVSAKQAAGLERKLPTVRGVKSVTYYPDDNSLQVFFEHATTGDVQAVSNLVTQG